MKTDNIKQVKIDNLGRLCIYPEKENFNGVWRTATEVHWDEKELCLYSPKPRDWSYIEWYKHIIIVAKDECYCDLLLTKDTLWTDIPGLLKEQILTG
jgi:hypothetical protein